MTIHIPFFFGLNSLWEVFFKKKKRGKKSKPVVVLTEATKKLQ